MATRSLTYLDIPLEVRQEAASQARATLRALLVNPIYSEDQRAGIRKQIEHVTSWESGTLQVEGLPVTAPRVGSGPGMIKTGFG